MRTLRKLIDDSEGLFWLVLIWLSSYVFVIYSMVYLEDKSLFDAFYYSIVVTGTIGFGDISPTHNVAKFATIMYILTAVFVLTRIIEICLRRMKVKGYKKRRGQAYVKKDPFLVICGYPSKEKVEEIVDEIRAVIPYANIVCITDVVENKEPWMYDKHIYFIHGRPTVRKVMNRANIKKAKFILFLAGDTNDVKSDEITAASILLCEEMSPNIHSIAERVRSDCELFEAAHCNKVVSICRANELAQEILNPGTFDLVDTIFSSFTPQRVENVIFSGTTCSWLAASQHYLKDNIISLGYSNDECRTFTFCPKNTDTIHPGYCIKILKNTGITT